MTRTFAIAAFAAVAVGKTVPTIPDPHKMTIQWTETVKSTGTVYTFAHHRAYNIAKQLYKDEELQNGKDLVQVTVERPALDKKAYQADMVRSACQNWTFTSLINGFVQTWEDMELEKSEKFDGVMCDKWTKTLGNSTDPWKYSVWFDQKNGLPVGVYNDDDAKGGAVDGGIKHIKDFSTKIAIGEFDIPSLCKKEIEMLPAVVEAKVDFAGAVAAGTHYGDPLAGPCLSDEQNITIQGVSGSVCSPAATGVLKQKCPTDTPAGCTITPAAILQDTSGDKYCALECTPSLPIKDQKLADSICGVDNMSCKPISGVGICTYDA